MKRGQVVDFIYFNKLRSMKACIFSLILLVFTCPLAGQDQVNVTCIAFYNVENLFDTIDSPDTDDFEFTPKGPNLYNSAVYYDKLDKLARVISEIGTEYSPDGPALLGVAEIENRTVLEDFVLQPAIAKRGYKILHHDSGDGRGVDVALLYQPKYFTPEALYPYPLVIDDDNDTVIYSRDILIVVGKLNNERVAVSVNHWPSRRGGATRTAIFRNAAAAINRHVLDSLNINCGVKKAIVMGDLNDDPVDDSVHNYLKAGRATEKLDDDEMYNPMEDFYRKGLGTNAYHDAWSLFDQIILSSELLKDKDGMKFYKAGIHNPAYMMQKSGSYKGYPLRTYANGAYAGGYSDHFPVYIVLVHPKT